MENMKASATLQLKIVEFIAKSKRPALLFSYEKALLAPGEISEAVIRFVGDSPSEEGIRKLSNIVQPSEQGYVVTQDPLRRKVNLHVDVLASDRVAGWARDSDGNQVSLKIDVDGGLVATTSASLPRRDLAQRFGGSGRFAFDVSWPAAAASPSAHRVTITDAQSGVVLFRGAVNETPSGKGSQA
jgi:hypothetical protein